VLLRAPVFGGMSLARTTILDGGKE
jgi:hypothetical protein